MVYRGGGIIKRAYYLIKINMDLSKQYDNFAEDFSVNQKVQNQINREEMYKMIGENISNKKVLDLACGDGIDAEYYRSLGASVVGIDSSEKLIEIAKEKYPEVSFTCGLAEELPFVDQEFDAVYSKYAIMTSPNMNPIFDQVYRVLKKGGEFVYLVTHPFRQFMERKDLSSDYFSQTVVDCIILGGTVHLKEPTHTMNEYFNRDFLSKFDVVDYKEVWDPAAEQIGGGKYPGFFIVKAIKR